MTVLVGVSPTDFSPAAVELGVLLARSRSSPLVLAAINSVAWPPSRRGADAEYQQFLVENANATLDRARSLVPEDIEVRQAVRGESSARRGLLAVAEEMGAERIVIASSGSSETGIDLGSTASGLAQSSPVPVAIAPHGYRAPEGARIERISAAYSGSDISSELILGAAGLAGELGIGLRVVSFASRHRVPATSSVGVDAEAEILEEWRAEIRERADDLLGDIARFSQQPSSVEVEVGSGRDWQEALRDIDWLASEVLLVGPSSLGPLARVSLGSYATKIVRNSPVPVVLVPRQAVETYA